ncbi:MAG: nucleotidyltransferase family protein [Sphingomonadaceae bacterium]|nr:nucleotidyltransferase family protein [Sphingomonadaceae bacterium]
MLLVDALRDPSGITELDADGWTALLAMARAEQLLGTVARRLSGLSVPGAVANILGEARINAEYQRRSALWEADCARRALAGYPGKVVLMKGTAYAAAGLKASEGRHIGDLDIMVARDDLPQVEAALLAAGWEWVKSDPYDDAYYRDHMHELPPLIHKERDRMIDVHHTILPLTARPKPDAVAMLEDAVALENGLYVLSPRDMVIHSAAHLFADGELDGGLRNLWDIHCLLAEFGDESFWQMLKSRAEHHQLWPAVYRAGRLAHRLYGTEIAKDWQRRNRWDNWYAKRLTARDDWGRGTRKFIRLIFYIRSHWLRMPPLMLARHLWVKWRKPV